MAVADSNYYLGHPAVAMTADFSHMVVEGGGTAEGERAVKWIHHVHTADDNKIWSVLTPCLRILKQLVVKHNNDEKNIVKSKGAAHPGGS